MSVLDRCGQILQEIGLDVAMHTYILHYLVTNVSYQSLFLNMDSNFRIQWVHIIANSGPSGPLPPADSPHPPLPSTF